VSTFPRYLFDGGGTPWKQVGKYERESQSFTVERIPRPPEARAVIEPNAHSRSTHMGWELAHACPHCLKEIRLRWGTEVNDSIDGPIAWRALSDSPDGLALAASEAISYAQDANRRARDAEDAKARVAKELRDMGRTLKHERSRAVKAQGSNRKKRRGW
jgi:hypothetical protein